METHFGIASSLKKPSEFDAVFRTQNILVASAAASADQDMIGGNFFAVRFYGMGMDKACKALDHINLILAQYVVIRTMNMVDICAAVGNQPLPVKGVDSSVNAIISAVLIDGIGYLRRMPHDFFRYTTHVDTGVAQFLGFNQCTFWLYMAARLIYAILSLPR